MIDVQPYIDKLEVLKDYIAYRTDFVSRKEKTRYTQPSPLYCLYGIGNYRMPIYKMSVPIDFEEYYNLYKQTV